jgi:hypothetical protein
MQDVAIFDGEPASVCLVGPNLTELVQRLTDHLYGAFQPQHGAAPFHLDDAWVGEQLIEWQGWLRT